MKNRMNKLALTLAIIAAASLPAMAQSDVGEIVSSASTTFSAVASLCVVIGTFMVGYRLARKVR
jgi:hypothetical protein